MPRVPAHPFETAPETRRAARRAMPAAVGQVGRLRAHPAHAPVVTGAPAAMRTGPPAVDA